MDLVCNLHGRLKPIGGELMINLEDIKKSIISGMEDERFVAWMQLYSLDERELADSELQRIINSQDPILKILFGRFLALVGEERAIGFLVQLLGDQNRNVVLAAIKAFAKNHYIFKLRHLVPVINAVRLEAQEYAIEQLSLAGEADVIDPLLDLLKRAPEKLVPTILAGLRHLPDQRLVLPIGFFVSHPKAEIRLQAIFVLGALFEVNMGNIRPRLILALRDPSPSVRKAALWALCKKPSRKDLGWLKDMSLHDVDAFVRQECIEGLKSFYAVSVILHLLKLITHDKDRRVTLKCESILLGMPLELLAKAFAKSQRDKDEKLRSKALLIFSSYQQQSENFCKLVLRQLGLAADDKTRLSLIETLGNIRAVTALGILESYLGKTFILAYAAMGAILKIWVQNPTPTLQKYLVDPKLPALLKQMVLKRLLYKKAQSVLDVPMVHILIGLLKDHNLNIRYLASQVLVFSRSEMAFDPLFDLLVREQDPASLQFLQASFLQEISQNFDTFLRRTIAWQYDFIRLSRALGLVEKVALSEEQYIRLFTNLLALEGKDYDDLCLSTMTDILGRVPLLLGPFLNIIRSCPAPARRFCCLVVFLKIKKIREITIGLEDLSPWFVNATVEVQGAVFDLAGLSRTRRLIPFIVAEACHGHGQDLRAKATAALNSILSFS